MNKLLHFGVLLTLTFLLTAYSKPTSINNTSPPQQESQIKSVENETAIQNYLDTKVMTPVFGGPIFSAHKLLGTDQGKIYIWALLQEYYKEGSELKQGSGMSAPLVLTVEQKPDGTQVTGHKLPRDGSLYVKDVQSMFPKELQHEIYDFPTTQDVQKLIDQAHQRAEVGQKAK